MALRFTVFFVYVLKKKILTNGQSWNVATFFCGGSGAYGELAFTERKELIGRFCYISVQWLHNRECLRLITNQNFWGILYDQSFWIPNCLAKIIWKKNNTVYVSLHLVFWTVWWSDSIYLGLYWINYVYIHPIHKNLRNLPWTSSLTVVNHFYPRNRYLWTSFFFFLAWNSAAMGSE